jgi:hypothetical protein
LNARGPASGRRPDVPLAGHWQLSLDVLISDFEKRRFDLGLPIN